MVPHQRLIHMVDVADNTEGTAVEEVDKEDIIRMRGTTVVIMDEEEAVIIKNIVNYKCYQVIL